MTDPRALLLSAAVGFGLVPPTEPKLRRLMWEFGDGLRFTWVMGGLARQYGPRA